MFIASSGSHIVVLWLYVDDITLIDNSSSILHSFIELVSHQFAMKDVGDLHYFWGIRVVRSSSSLLKQKYGLDLLHKFLALLNK